MIPSRYLGALFALAVCLLGPGVGRAADTAASSRAIAEGNRAYRSANYQAAVSRYLAAQGLGDESTLLNFNLGVAYYQLQDYQKAERSLRRAAQDSTFSTRARYNLGLVYWARRDTRSARSSFEAVEQLAGDRRIRALAVRALDELHRGADSPALRRIRYPGVDGGRSVTAALNMGINSNIYRTPDQAYVDLPQAGTPLITPEKATGTFVGTSLLAQEQRWTGRHTLLRLAYAFDGNFYTDRQYSNADESFHRLTLSARKNRGPNLDRTLLTAFNIGYSQEAYYDPDDGADRFVSGVDVSDRFHYLNALVLTHYERPVGRVTLGVRGIAELRDYNDVEIVPQYDSQFFLGGASAIVPIVSATRLKLAYDWFQRDYDERQALDSNGAVGVANPALTYQYNMASATALTDLESTSWNIGYELTDRSDRFVGYNDYRRHIIRVAGRWRPLRRLVIDFSGAFGSYDYPNAFAFDTPAGGRKTVDYVEVIVSTSFLVTRGLRLSGNLGYTEFDSSDPRIAYSQTQIPIGVSWTQEF